MLKFKNLLTLLFLTFSALHLYASTPSVVTIQDRKILVNGSVFNIQGVNYSPVPPGPGNTSGYPWVNTPIIYNTDLPLIKAMGANTIRTYQESNISQAFLDSAYQNGIYVIVGWGQYLGGQDFTNASTRASYVSQFVSFVNQYKNHPAVLMWCFGNEIENHTNGVESSWYTLLQQAAAQVKIIDPNHPVTTANSEIAEIGNASLNADDASLSSSNFVWGVNVYRGKNFSQSFFNDMNSKTAKPFFISEFGCDAWNGVSAMEDDAMQDTYIRSQWADISANLASGGNSCSGGLVFEWCDEWWKGDSTPNTLATIGQGGVNGNNFHDTETDWPNPAYTDDPNINEEWWGLVSVAQGTASRTPRLAYNSLKSLWAHTDTITPVTSTTTTTTTSTTSSAVPSGIFQGAVRNFPNPFLPGRDTTRIEFTVNGTPNVEVVIFDLTGRKIFQQSSVIDLGAGVMAADWDGRDDNNSFVASGLYICRVRAKTTTQEETRYRKIAVVK